MITFIENYLWKDVYDWWQGKGWYYMDETAEYCGPYDTAEKATNAFDNYIRYLNNENPIYDSNL